MKSIEELGADLAESGKNATQIMIFLPHYMWAKKNLFEAYSRVTFVKPTHAHKHLSIFLEASKSGDIGVIV